MGGVVVATVPDAVSRHRAERAALGRDGTDDESDDPPTPDPAVVTLEIKRRDRERAARNLLRPASKAAGEGDCRRVRVLDAQILRLDATVHHELRADAAIMACLAVPASLPP